MANTANISDDNTNAGQPTTNAPRDRGEQDGQSLAKRIEQQLRALMHFDGAVAVGEDGAVYLSGRVPSQRDRQQAQLVARELSGGAPVEDDLVVERVLPDDRGAFATEDLVEEPEAETVTGTIGPTGELNPDFTGQPLDTNDLNAIGSGALDDDPDEEPDPTFFPPTDPVVRGDALGQLEVLGGWDATSMSSDDVAPSVEDNQPGDAALQDAVVRELREDATTTALAIQVVVINGVAHLRGHVADLEDAENAEAVAGRVPGIRDVVDETDVQAMDTP